MEKSLNKNKKKGLKSWLWIVYVLMLLVTVSSAMAAYSDKVIVYYTFDGANQSAGNPLDVSGNGYHGTRTSATVNVTTPTSEGYSFDGIDDKVTQPTAGMNTDEGGVCVKFNYDSFDNYDRLYSSTDTGNRIYLGIRDAGSGPKLWYRLGSLVDTYGDTTINAGSWYLGCLTWDNGNVQIYLNNETDDTLKSGSLVSITNPSHIGIDNGGAGYWFDGTIDALYVFNETPTGAEINELYEYNETIPVVNITNYTINVLDSYTSLNIDNFSVEVGGVNYSTTTDTIITNILNNASLLYDVKIFNAINDYGYYFNRTYTNQNVSSNLLGELYQSEVNFNSLQYITNALLTSTGTITYNIDGANYTNSTKLYPNAGTYNVTAYVPGNYSVTNEITINALDNMTFNASGVYDAKINIRANHTADNATILNFNGYVYNTTLGQNTSYSTTTGLAQVNTLQGYNYTVTIQAENYSTGNLTESQKYVYSDAANNAVAFYLYKFNSFIINFYDEITNNIIDYTTTVFEYIGATISGNTSTSDGTLYINLLNPDSYTLRYSAPDYQERFYYLTLSNNTYNILDLYLLNVSAEYNVTINVIDQYGYSVEGATVKALKYYSSSNSYVNIAEKQTDVNGNSIFQVEFNAEFYKFVVEYEGETKVTTNPSYITTDTYQIQIFVGESDLGEYDTWSSIDYDLSFNDATNNFRLSWNDVNGLTTNMELSVNKLTGYGNSYYNSTTSTSSAGSLLVQVDNTTGDHYIAYAYYTNADGEKFMLAQLIQEFPADNVFNNFGLILQIIISLVFVGTAIWSKPLGAILVPTSLILGKLVGFNAISWEGLIALQVAGFVFAFLLSKNQ